MFVTFRRFFKEMRRSKNDFCFFFVTFFLNVTNNVASGKKSVQAWAKTRKISAPSAAIFINRQSRITQSHRVKRDIVCVCLYDVNGGRYLSRFSRVPSKAIILNVPVVFVVVVAVLGVISGLCQWLY